MSSGNIPGLPRPSRLNVSGNLNVGAVKTNPDDWGAADARNLIRLGNAGQAAGREVMRYGIQVYNEQVQASKDEIFLAGYDKTESYKKMEYQKQGQDALDVEDNIKAFMANTGSELEAKLDKPAAKELFRKEWARYTSRSASESADYVIGESKRWQDANLNAKNEMILRDIQDHPGYLPARLPEIMNNVAQRYQGMGDTVIRNEQEKAAFTVISKSAESLLAMTADPNEAFALLNDPTVQEYLSPGQYRALCASQFKAIQSQARKNTENEMRKIGLALGETYDTEIDIIRALADIDDRELADIARKEAEVVRKARLLGGKEDADDEQARLARETATRIAGGAKNEGDVLAATDSLENVTEKMRSDIYKDAVARLKVKQAVETEKMAEISNEALKTMEEAGWNPGAVNPEWPDTIQRKMRELSEKKITADPVKALEYCDETRERLQARIRAGEWPQMTVELGGANSPEYKHVWGVAYANKGAGGGGGDNGKGLLTPLQQGRNEFLRITKTDPASKQGKESYSQFLHAFNEALEKKAAEPEYEGNVSKLPGEAVQQVVDAVMQTGTYKAGIWYWTGFSSGQTKRAFEVYGNPELDDSLFIPGATQTTTPAPEIVLVEDIPEYAQAFIGPRDRERRVLADGSVSIVNSKGSRIIVTPDGNSVEYKSTASKGATEFVIPSNVTYDEFFGNVGDYPIW